MEAPVQRRSMSPGPQPVAQSPVVLSSVRMPPAVAVGASVAGTPLSSRTNASAAPVGTSVKSTTSSFSAAVPVPTSSPLASPVRTSRPSLSLTGTIQTATPTATVRSVHQALAPPVVRIVSGSQQQPLLLQQLEGMQCHARPTSSAALSLKGTPAASVALTPNASVTVKSTVSQGPAVAVKSAAGRPFIATAGTQVRSPLVLPRPGQAQVRQANVVPYLAEKRLAAAGTPVVRKVGEDSLLASGNLVRNEALEEQLRRQAQQIAGAITTQLQSTTTSIIASGPARPVQALAPTAGQRLPQLGPRAESVGGSWQTQPPMPEDMTTNSLQDMSPETEPPEARASPEYEVDELSSPDQPEGGVVVLESRAAVVDDQEEESSAELRPLAPPLDFGAATDATVATGSPGAVTASPGSATVLLDNSAGDVSEPNLEESATFVENGVHVDAEDEDEIVETEADRAVPEQERAFEAKTFLGEVIPSADVEVAESQEVSATDGNAGGLEAVEAQEPPSEGAATSIQAPADAAATTVVDAPQTEVLAPEEEGAPAEPPAEGSEEQEAPAPAPSRFSGLAGRLLRAGFRGVS